MFIDADSVVLENIEELFQIQEFAAVYECCDRFNTGVFVAFPSQSIFQDMLNQIPFLPSYDIADQGFLNSYFHGKWKQLPFGYNAMQNTYLFIDRRAWDMSQVKIIHYIKFKPWSISETDKTKHNLHELHSKWWNAYFALPKKHQTLRT